MTFIVKKKSHCAVTLLELLLAIAVVVILATAITPRLSTLFKQEIAISELKSVIEIARTTAMREGLVAYVAFASEECEEDSFTRYGYFIEDERYFHPNPLIKPVKAIGKWRRLPDGLVFAKGEDFETRDTEEEIMTLLDLPKKQRREFPLPVGSCSKKALPFVAFMEEGTVVFPTPDFITYQNIGLANGYFDQKEKKRVFLKMLDGKNGKKPRADLLQINYYSGRVRRARQ